MLRVNYKKVGVLKDESGHSYNPRGNPGDTIELQTAIARDGQRTPLTVTEPNEDGLYLLTRGHRRKAAIDALRTDARKRVKEYNEELMALGDSTASDHHDPQVIAIGKLHAQAKLDVIQYSYYLIQTNGIQPDDTIAVLRDMDAGIIHKEVDPVALGETMRYRIDHFNWTLQQCCESLDLTESKAVACVRAADPQQTAESVRRALRTFEMSLSMYIKKMSKLDLQTQQKVMKAAESQAEQNKNSHGVVNARIINSVMRDMTAAETPPTAPDADVLPLLHTAKENIYLALNIQDQWSLATTEAALWHLEEMSLTIWNLLKTQGSPHES